MPVGVLTLEIQIPYAHSLKEKRAVLRKIRDRLRARFNVAVAELDHQDVLAARHLGSRFDFRQPNFARFGFSPGPRGIGEYLGG